MSDYVARSLLALIGLGLVAMGAFLYEAGRSDERKAAELGYGGIKHLEAENEALRGFIAAMFVCTSDDADARTCPLYDEDEPNRCAKERVMEELGLRHDD